MADETRVETRSQLPAPAKPPRAHPFNGAPLVPGNPGNSGGKKGRSGPKTKAFLERCLEASEDPTLWTAARKRNAMSLLDLAAGYAHGKPKQDVTLDGELVIRVAYDSQREEG